MGKLRLVSKDGDTTDLQILDEDNVNLIEKLNVTKVVIEPLEINSMINVTMTVECVSLDLSVLPENVVVDLTGANEEHIVKK